MRILVNGLSIGSLSGQHVVFGFLSKLAEWKQGEHEFIVLHDEATPLPDHVNFPNVTSVALPHRLRNWAVRLGWELTGLPKLIEQHRVDVLLNPSGAKVPRIKCRQVVLAQNPWCFVRQAHQGWRDTLKASLQRQGYRSAFQSADLMFYISDHLRTLYRDAAGRGPEAESDITYVGIDDETFRAASKYQETVERDPNLILSVSAMAPWKGTETLISSLHLLRKSGLPSKLKLIGPWPDETYRHRIHQQITALELWPHVEISGKVSKEELHRSYASATAFCLMSHCESFGIPAAEAQAFGTPTVVSTGCAMPEVCGKGAMSGTPGDPEWTAQALAQLMTSPTRWHEYSSAAKENVEKLRWEKTARPFQKIFLLLG